MASRKDTKMKSSKQSGETSKHILTLHQRLYHFLSLGSRSYDGKESKWQCNDIEIQRHVLKSIASFLDCISGDILHNPLVKDSIADIIEALVWILQHKSKAVLSATANLVVKLINILPNSLLQSYLLDFVHPLASLLSYSQLDVSISCAIALNLMFLNLSVRKEKVVWDILIETDAVSQLVSGIRQFSNGGTSVKYFQEMASLLSTILQHWPSSRYHVWNNDELLKALEFMRVKPDFSIKVSVLKLYSSLELIRSEYIRNSTEIFVGQAEYTEAQFMSTLQEICMGDTSPGLK